MPRKDKYVFIFGILVVITIIISIRFEIVYVLWAKFQYRLSSTPELYIKPVRERYFVGAENCRPPNSNVSIIKVGSFDIIYASENLEEIRKIGEKVDSYFLKYESGQSLAALESFIFIGGKGEDEYEYDVKDFDKLEYVLGLTPENIVFSDTVEVIDSKIFLLSKKNFLSPEELEKILTLQLPNGIKGFLLYGEGQKVYAHLYDSLDNYLFLVFEKYSNGEIGCLIAAIESGREKG